MARVAVGGFLHETNSFVPARTDFAHFARGGEMPPLLRGDEITSRLAGGNHGMSGALAALGASGHTVVPLLWAHGGAGGTVTDDAFERIAGELLDALLHALPVDGVYLDLHGAMVTETVEDADGELLGRVRAVVGASVPVVASLDFHANVTGRMVDAVDALAIYRTYPHVDRKHAGARAAAALDHLLRDRRPLAKALRRVPYLIPLHWQCTTVSPMREIVAASAQAASAQAASAQAASARAASARADSASDAHVLSLVFAAGFPPSDLRECGPAVVAMGHDADAVRAAADALERLVLDSEPLFGEPEYDAATAVQLAIERSRDAGRPVVLADTQDNPGGGGTGDTTGVLAELVHQRAPGAALAILVDEAAAAAAHAAGEGTEIELALGGRHGPPGVVPLVARCVVRRLASGRFVATGRTIGGRQVDLGPTALLDIGGVEVVVSSRRMQANDPEVFRHLGVEPATKRILALKSSVHFRADFEPIAEAVMTVIAPGWHQSDPATFPYRRLRRGVRLRPGVAIR